MRIVFMGTPEFSVATLERLIATDYDIVAVYTQPDSPAGRGRELKPSLVKQLALAQGLTVVQPTSLKRPEPVGRLVALNPDVIVVAAYGFLLPQEVLDAPPLGCLNVHPSLLPRHRGPSPIAGAILAGDDETGVTIMLIDARVDSGPILAQRRVPITSEDTAASLGSRLADLGAKVLVETLAQWAEHRITPVRQDEGKATYTRRLSKEAGEVDWHLPALALWRSVRAFHPWPGCYTRWRGKMLKLLEVAPVSERVTGEVGQVVDVQPVKVVDGRGTDVSIGVVTGDGVLGLRRLQLEGRRAVFAEEFARGQRGFVGSLLPC
ncbi:MAG: methionyl-tRNA formyltransferase [Chloroflexota bacterium]